MTDVLFKKVVFDDEVDPVRVEYTWWEDLPTTRPTTFGLWIKSEADVNQNALLAVQREADGKLVTYLHDFSTGERREAGQVAHFSPGRLVAEFPRKLISSYGPAVQWWAQASKGEDDQDTYFDEDSDTRFLTE
jgi:hypothetical protein